MVKCLPGKQLLIKLLVTARLQTTKQKHKNKVTKVGSRLRDRFVHSLREVDRKTRGKRDFCKQPLVVLKPPPGPEHRRTGQSGLRLV